jgi:hypothetical protein
VKYSDVARMLQEINNWRVIIACTHTRCPSVLRPQLGAPHLQQRATRRSIKNEEETTEGNQWQKSIEKGDVLNSNVTRPGRLHPQFVRNHRARGIRRRQIFTA